MGSDAPDLQAHDLFLLATHFAGPDGCTLTTLDKMIVRLTGITRTVSQNGGRLTRRDALAEWQLASLSEELLSTHDSITSAATSEPSLHVTSRGLLKLSEQFGDIFLQRSWSNFGDRYLVARTLGMPPSAGPQRMKRLDTAEGLRLAVVRRAWGLRIPESATLGQVRNALAARALGDAFGKPVERQIGLDHRMSGKAARTIAAQLLEKKRRISTDSQLIIALATQHLGTTSGDAKSLRQALVRKHFGLNKKQSRVDPATLDETEAPSGQAIDTNAFLRAVRSSAKLNANGWSGNRKAYISHVWRTICDSHPDWRLSADMFKSMLMDAHRLGEVVLINADLRDKKNMRDVQDSAIQYKNMEWHYVQIAD